MIARHAAAARVLHDHDGEISLQRHCALGLMVFTVRDTQLGCFTVTIVSTGFIFAWLRPKSGSLWPTALHASHNLLIQDIVDNLMRNTGRTRWYTTEFG